MARTNQRGGKRTAAPPGSRTVDPTKRRLRFTDTCRCECSGLFGNGARGTRIWLVRHGALANHNRQDSLCYMHRAQEVHPNNLLPVALRVAHELRRLSEIPCVVYKYVNAL